MARAVHQLALSVLTVAAIGAAAACSASPARTQAQDSDLALGSDGGAAPEAAETAPATGDPVTWNANDVSILYPLARANEQDLLIGMTSTHRGIAKVLLPKTLFERLRTEMVPLVETDVRDLYPELRVASVRLDPCVDRGDGSAPCRQQVRLSVQPISAEVTDGTYDLLDGSVHLFYDVDPVRWVRLARELQRLGAETPRTAPLSVHPMLAKEGLAGSFAAKLREALLEVCDETTLVRFTAMTQLRSGVNWTFGIYDRKADGTFERAKIPGDAPSDPGDELVDGYSDFGEFGPADKSRKGAARFETWFPNDILSTQKTKAMTEADYTAALDVLRTIENPRLRTTAQVRCATCHLANATVRLAANERGLARPPPSPSAFPGALAYESGDVVKTNMHAFSYFQKVPTISQRTANDTHHTLSLLTDPSFIAGLPPDAKDALLAR